MIDYQLLDSGNKRKLERWGQIFVSRPDPTAYWKPSLSQMFWDKSQAQYQTSCGHIGSGFWKFDSQNQYLASDGLKIHCQLQPDFDPLHFQIKFMPSKHLGLFPEHFPQWVELQKLILRARRGQVRPFKVLNLFGYTGAATLACAQAGAEVTHIDSSYEAIGLGRVNQDISHLNDARIRWIKEDVSKFVIREVRRQNEYDGIILDPPAFGHGVNGESWSSLRDLLPLLQQLKNVLTCQPSFILLNTYALGKNNAVSSLRREFSNIYRSILPVHDQGVLNLNFNAHSQNSSRDPDNQPHILTTGSYDWWKSTHV